MDHKVFDTYKTSKGLDNYIRKGIPEGWVVVAACEDECTTQLSQLAKNWFIDMGSMEIQNLKYR